MHLDHRTDGAARWWTPGLASPYTVPPPLAKVRTVAPGSPRRAAARRWLIRRPQWTRTRGEPRTAARSYLSGTSSGHLTKRSTTQLPPQGGGGDRAPAAAAFLTVAPSSWRLFWPRGRPQCAHRGRPLRHERTRRREQGRTILFASNQPRTRPAWRCCSSGRRGHRAEMTA